MRKLQILLRNQQILQFLVCYSFSAQLLQCEDKEKLLRRKRMAEFGFFVLGAVIGVPAALGGLGAYVRTKVCKCDG